MKKMTDSISHIYKRIILAYIFSRLKKLTGRISLIYKRIIYVFFLRMKETVVCKYGIYYQSSSSFKMFVNCSTLDNTFAKTSKASANCHLLYVRIVSLHVMNMQRFSCHINENLYILCVCK
jgi:hypothetical protein